MSGVQYWWIKTATGEVFGPFDTSAMYRLIDKLLVDENDFVGAHPEKKWIQLSKSMFAKIIAQTKEIKKPLIPEQDKLTDLRTHASVEAENSKIAMRNEAVDERTVVDQSLASASGDRKYGSVKIKAVKANREKSDTHLQVVRSARPAPPPATKFNLLDFYEKNKTLIKSRAPLIISFLVAGGILYYSFFNGGVAPEGQIHLLAPLDLQQSIPEREVQTSFKKALRTFEADTYANYFVAQNELVRILEGAPKSSDALSLLCLTHLELWPFSFRDSADLASVTKTVQMAAKADPIGTNGATCRATQQFINGRIDEAKNIADAAILNNPGAAVFYEFKGVVLGEQGEPSTAVAYFKKVQELWPEWLKSYVSEAEYRIEINDFSTAATILREVIRKNPHHAKAKALMGIIEYTKYGHFNEAFGLLKTALEERLDPKTFAKSSYTFAVMNEQSKKFGEALKWAKKSYQANPTIPGAKDLLVRLGGEKLLSEISKSDIENMAVGDQYLLSGNYLAAQAQFKAAYEQNPKNAVAAVKAARSLWKLNQGLEAIRWLERAIHADSKLIEAYITLADYYSSRFDFGASSGVLQNAQKISPKSYEVYRGWAQLELRRNDYGAAITNAKKALSFYDTDVGTHIIIINAYRNRGDVREAYQWASKAIELDRGSSEALGLYAEVLGDYQGFDAGYRYIKQLVENYPKNLDYQITLAKILRREDRFLDTIEVLKYVVATDPSNKDALLLLGQAYQSMERSDEALSSYLAAAALDPSDATPIFFAGRLYLQFKKPLPAISQFERVLMINSKYPKAHIFIGRSAQLINDQERAIKEATLEKKINPDIADPYLLAGDAYMETKQYNKATMEYQSALKIRTQGAELYVKLARAYRLSGQFDIALSMLRTAEAKESGYTELYKEYGAVYEMKNDVDGAIKFYNRYLEVLPNAPDRSAIEGRIKNLGGVVE